VSATTRAFPPSKIRIEESRQQEHSLASINLEEASAQYCRGTILEITRRFDMSSARYRKIVNKLAFAALALGILASAGNAQNAYEGKFTLPFEVYWGGSTLPAGDYTFELASQSSPYTLYIHGQKSNVIIRAISADTGVGASSAQLDLVDISDVHTIKTFEAPELGVTFSYYTPKEKHMAPKEVRHKGLSQTEPATQVSQNKMSIAVQSSGR
jgi:hypothetical protein